MAWPSWLLGSTRASGSTSLTGATSKAKKNQTRFLSSQVGDESVINYSYTDMPFRLLAYDIFYFFSFSWALPYIVLPMSPTDSGALAELSPTLGNLFCVAVHFVLCILQILFILCLPLVLLFPVWMVVIGLALFFAVNTALCSLLNGRHMTYDSDPKYAPTLPEHSHEQWIFLNGVAVGEHWLKGNLNRLALTFKRPILGIHNRTSGIVFDVVECLIQRNFSYATYDVRMCYSIIKEKLYNPQYSKVVFILHSQGGIEGGLVLDWLLQELPQNLLAKLEVYTFGNAANHCNNPHRHLSSQEGTLGRGLGAATAAEATATATQEPVAAAEQTNGNGSSHAAASEKSNGLHSSTERRTRPSISTSILEHSAEASAAAPAAVSDRAIGHIEHYAHTTDFVALWGVLHFATSARERHTLPRFIGRVFLRTSERGGHQFCQHYLDGMFPLARDPVSGALKGCAEEGNEFMESEIVVGAEGDASRVAREAFEGTWLGETLDEDKARTEAVEKERERERQVEIHETSPVLTRNGTLRAAKVKDLSRLWHYRNGKSPPERPPLLPVDPAGFIRYATM